MAQYQRDTKQSDDGTVSKRVIAAVADALDVDPLELPPLYDVVDPDALDQLFDHGSPAGGNGPGRVVFTMADCEVVVHSDGSVDVTAPVDRNSASSVAGLAETEPSTD